MPSFGFLDKLELYIRTGKYPENASKSQRTVIRASSKRLIYRDGVLWRSHRGRLLRVVRSVREMREVLAFYHDNNNHAGRCRTVSAILRMYHWVGVTEAVKKWIAACAVCRNRTPAEPTPVRFCLAYSCDVSSFLHPELSFHRFPREAELRRRWLAAAQRDEASLRKNSFLCSRHFSPSCFLQSEDGQLMLSPDAVPTAALNAAPVDEMPLPSDEDLLHPNKLDDLLSTAAEATPSPDPSPDPSDPTLDRCDPPAELQEHQYCLPAPDPDSASVQAVMEYVKRRTVIEPSFMAYNNIARFLRFGSLPLQSKKSRVALKRMSKRFGLKDGVLMYTRVSPPLQVPRSREEVDSILKRFHDDRGHQGQSLCHREICRRYHWATLSRDLARWISTCSTCLTRTRRRWHRCSVVSCTNGNGPVERGLGLTFHKFPLHDGPLLARWLTAVGRSHWYPRLWSSICSIHFTEDCFDRSGGGVTLRSDATPTLMVNDDSAGSRSRVSTQPAAGEEAFFAKYDAVELYLRTRTYPPGLSYVEKNTFRTFCKKFTIKDGELHSVRGDRVRLVLRSRQQVDAALLDYHDELNHLDADKFLRLLNERYFWKTMRPDVVQWINNCSECSLKKVRKTLGNRSEAGRSETLLRPWTVGPPRHHSHSRKDDGDDDDEGDDEGDDDDECGGDEGDGSGGAVEEQLIPDSLGVPDGPGSPPPPQTVGPVTPQPRIPILLHLRTPIILQPRTPSSAPLVTRVWSVSRQAPPQETNRVQDRVEPQPENPSPSEDPKQATSSDARTHGQVRDRGGTEPLTDLNPPSELLQPLSGPEVQVSTQLRTRRSLQGPVKRRGEVEADPAAKRSSGCGLDPVVAPSNKPWPVFTIAAPAQVAPPPPEADSPAVDPGSRKLQARTVIQQVSEAKVKIRPSLDGADPQWAQIQEGMVVYVSFFHGATEDVTYEMANSLMATKLFRKDSGRLVSLLDLPGSVLFVHQDSLLGEVAPDRRMRYGSGCELWRGAQLFSNLVSTCKRLAAASERCTKAGVKVERGVYGQKQEIVLKSAEPMTLLLEF